VQAAYDLIAESVAISRAVGNRLGVADWVQQLGKVALYLGDITQAETCLQEALRLHEEIGSNPTHVLAVLGHVALARGDVAQAARYLHDSLAAAQEATRFVQHASRELLLIFISAADSLLRRALVAVAQGDLERAATLLGHVERQRTQRAYVLEPPLRAAGDDAVATLRAQLSPAAFQRAWDAGQALSLEAALALALER
jgi:tetratricopeptide (TPR) repeat protein